jgi:hypothetical protein
VADFFHREPSFRAFLYSRIEYKYKAMHPSTTTVWNKKTSRRRRKMESSSNSLGSAVSLVSPFNSSTTYFGTLNPYRTTNATVVYDPRTLPTPWPYLAASYALSFLCAVFGIISPAVTATFQELFRRIIRLFGRKERDDPPENTWGSFITVFKLIFLAILTIRSVSAFVIAVKAVGSNSARFAAPSALAVLLMAIVPYIVDKAAPHAAIRALGVIDALLVFIALCLMVYGTLNKSGFYYGRLFPAGGNCAIYVRNCNKLYLDLVGCGVGFNKYSTTDVNEIQRNPVAFSEAILGSLMFIMGLPVFVVAVMVVYSLARGLAWATRQIDNWTSKTFAKRERTEAALPRIPKLREKLENERVLRHFSWLTVFAILLFSVVALPINHYQMTRPRPHHVVDGGGPLALPETGPGYTYIFGNHTSWIDCFEVTPPHDRYGFWGLWWEEHRKQVETVLAVL